MIIYSTNLKSFYPQTFYLLVFLFLFPQAHLDKGRNSAEGGSESNDQKPISFLPNAYLEADIIAPWPALQMEMELDFTQEI